MHDHEENPKGIVYLNELCLCSIVQAPNINKSHAKLDVSNKFLTIFRVSMLKPILQVPLSMSSRCLIRDLPVMVAGTIQVDTS